jgi:hypothetical protein
VRKIRRSARYYLSMPMRFGNDTEWAEFAGEIRKINHHYYRVRSNVNAFHGKVPKESVSMPSSDLAMMAGINRREAG